MTFSTDTLRSLMDRQQGAATPNRFRVLLPDITGTQKAGGLLLALSPATKEELNLLCTAARIPGKSINVVDRNIGMEQVRVANGHTLGEVTLTFYLTNAYNVRKYFQEWSECIVSPEPPFTAGFHKNYAKPVYIEQLNKIGDVVYKVRLEKAYPTTFTEIELNNQAQGAALEFSVSLTYSNYVIE